MKKCIFVYRDRKTGSFTTPIIDDRAKENFIENYKRAFMVEPAQSHARNKDCTLYFLGMYDDVKATFELLPEPEFCFDVGDIDWKGEERYGLEPNFTEEAKA